MTLCCQCAFWRESQDHGDGHCHRNAPTPLLWGHSTAFLKGPLGQVFWPITHHSDGCGEGKPDEEHV